MTLSGKTKVLEVVEVGVLLEVEIEVLLEVVDFLEAEIVMSELIVIEEEVP